MQGCDLAWTVFLKGQRFWFYPQGYWHCLLVEEVARELALGLPPGGDQTLPLALHFFHWSQTTYQEEPRVYGYSISRNCWHCNGDGKTWVPQLQVPCWGPETLRTQPSALEHLKIHSGVLQASSPHFLAMCHSPPGMNFLFPWKLQVSLALSSRVYNLTVWGTKGRR